MKKILLIGLIGVFSGNVIAKDDIITETVMGASFSTFVSGVGLGYGVKFYDTLKVGGSVSRATGFEGGLVSVYGGFYGQVRQKLPENSFYSYTVGYGWSLDNFIVDGVQVTGNIVSFRVSAGTLVGGDVEIAAGFQFNASPDFQAKNTATNETAIIPGGGSLRASAGLRYYINQTFNLFAEIGKSDATSDITFGIIILR